MLFMSILFHDVGNIAGRKDHHKRVSEVYDFVFGSQQKLEQEKYIVTTIARAHTGRAADNSADTLKDVAEQAYFEGKSIRQRTLAAIVRFADELAEGRQRTCGYLLEMSNKFYEKSVLYHRYAQMTTISIDRSRGRIAIDYFPDIADLESERQFLGDDPLRSWLEFAYARICKLDQERKYARHYCELLAPFGQISVQFRFLHSGSDLELKLSPLVLSDLVVPGQQDRKIHEWNDEYRLEGLMDRIGAAIKERSKQ